MALNTRPKFYYIDPVTKDNQFINYLEPLQDNTEITVSVPVGSYTMTELAAAVQSALNGSGKLDYTVTFNRSTRNITISSTEEFELLVTTGSNAGLSIYPLIGFTSDKTGASTYDSDSLIGVEYVPQFPLQSYEDSKDNKTAISPSVNEAASGVKEIIRFGNKRQYTFNITFITDLDVGSYGPWIGTNVNAVSEANAFLDFTTDQNPIEFMPDIDDVNTFKKILLDRTPESRVGTDYKLKELINRNLTDYYETGRLVFRDLG